MKHLILIICLFILFGDINAQSISSEKYNKHLVREDFNNKQGHFNTITTNENYFILDKGDYLMSRHNSKSEYSIIANNSSVSDFILKTEFKIGPSDNKKASIGIILKAQENNKGAFIFEINKKREYRVKQLINGEYAVTGKTKRKGWVKNKIIKGEDKKNTVEIRSENNIYDIYINNKYLMTFSGSNVWNGSCGLIISSETKARISYYHINIKGDNATNADYKNNQNSNNTIESLNQEIKQLKENNIATNSLNFEKNKSQQDKINALEDKNIQLTSISNEKGKEITKLKQTINVLEEESSSLSREISNLTSQLKQQNSKLEEENNNVSKLNKTNIQNKKDIQSKDQQIQELNQRINLKKGEISELKKKNTSFSSVTIEQEKKINELEKLLNETKISENNAVTKNKSLNTKINGLQKQITSQSSKNNKLNIELKKSKNELSSVKETQEKNNQVVTNLNTQISNLNKRNESLNTNLNAINDKNKSLQNTNNELKELFVLKDFEINGVKPSEIKKEEIKNTPSVPKYLKGNKAIYAVQFGVYMQRKALNSIQKLDDVWYSTTEQGTYIYYSGEFSEPKEAAAHMHQMILKGYKDAFVVTLTK